MPGVANLMVFDMVREFYGPAEARKMMPRYYGFAEASAGSPQEDPDRKSWLTKLSRSMAAMVAASVAAVQRL